MLSNTLKMLSGGEGCAIDAKVTKTELHTVPNAQYIASEVLVV